MVYPCQIVWADVDVAKLGDPQPCSNPTGKKTSHTNIYANKFQIKLAWCEPNLHLCMPHQKSMKNCLLNPEIWTTANYEQHNCQIQPWGLFHKQKVYAVMSLTWMRIEIFPCLFEGPPLISNGHDVRANVSSSFCSSSRTTMFSNSEEWATISITYS